MDTYRPGNAHHVGARETQEDAFAFSDVEDRAFVAHGGVLAVVADGMGGLSKGQAASNAATSTFLHTYLSKSAAESIPKTLLRALHEANAAVLTAARAADRADDMGTTLAAAVIHDGSLHWISVGDSRVYLLRAGRVWQVTADHVYAADLQAQVANGQLRPSEARRHADREALTSHLGMKQVHSIDRSVRPFRILEDDWVIVCSDGFYRALPAEEIAARLPPDPQQACDAWLEAILSKRRPAQDNITVLTLASKPTGAGPGRSR